jgi:SAM-dependent methyltransferase
MLNAAKASPKALLSAAKDLLDKKQYSTAEFYVLEILRRDINNHEALAALAELHAAQGKIKEAFAYYMFAIRANPASLAYKERFIDLSGNHFMSAYDPLTEQTIVECLKMGEALDCRPLNTLWATHLMANPAFHTAFGLADRKALDPANRAFFEGLTDFKPLFLPCFLLGIRNFSPCSQIFEEFIVHVRRHLLDDIVTDKKKFTEEERLLLATALAHHSLLTDYILDGAEEQGKIEALRASIEAGEKAGDDAPSVALLASYEPLYKLKNAAQLLEKFFSAPEIGDVVKTQIADYNALRETAASITAITPIDSGVSTQVQEQYEEFPYPRWKSLPKTSLLGSWLLHVEEFAKKFRDKKVKILSAGCGTGKEPLMLAALFPKAEILAVDLSRTSMAYAINKARQYKINNITFRQADILKLDVLNEKFDYIVSGGVLHHLEDPVKGWRVLCGLLKPDGLMTIGLYSKTARRAIMKAQETRRREHYADDAASMKLFRKKSPQLLERAVFSDIIRFTDYYYLSMYRDLLFNVQEHNYTLPEIESILEELKLDFSGFVLDPSVLAAYGEEHPDDPEKTNLGHWHRFEQKNPATFDQMYLFWCRKKAALP